MHAEDVIDEIPLVIHIIVTEETLVEFTNPVMCSKVRRYVSNLFVTMLAIDSWRSAIWIH